MCMAKGPLACLLCRYLASPDARQCCNWITCGIIGEQQLGPDSVVRKLQSRLALGSCAAAAWQIPAHAWHLAIPASEFCQITVQAQRCPPHEFLAVVVLWLQWQPTFQKMGLALSLQHIHSTYHIQIDVMGAAPGYA